MVWEMTGRFRQRALQQHQSSPKPSQYLQLAAGFRFFVSPEIQWNRRHRSVARFPSFGFGLLILKR